MFSSFTDLKHYIVDTLHDILYLDNNKTNLHNKQEGRMLTLFIFTLMNRMFLPDALVSTHYLSRSGIVELSTDRNSPVRGLDS